MVKFIITDSNIISQKSPFGINICEVVKVSKEEVKKENFFDANYDEFASFIMLENKMGLEESMCYRKTLNKSNRLKDIEIARCIIGMKKVLYTIIDEALFSKKSKYSVILDLTETPRVNIIGIIKCLVTSLDFVNREIEIYLAMAKSQYSKIQEKQVEMDTWTEKLKSEGIAIERVKFMSLM